MPSPLWVLHYHRLPTVNCVRRDMPRKPFWECYTLPFWKHCLCNNGRLVGRGILPGWHPQRQMSSRRPSESNNWHTRKFFSSQSFFPVIPRALGYFTISPWWMRCFLFNLRTPKSSYSKTIGCMAYACRLTRRVLCERGKLSTKLVLYFYA